MEPENKTSKEGKNTGMAILAYIIFFVPLLTDAKNEPFVKYHVKQGLVVFIFAVVSWFVSVALPIIGWVLSPFLHIAVLVFAILGIINAANGQEKELPLIGQFARQINL